MDNNNSGLGKHHHLYVGILYCKKTARGEKDLGFVKIENTDCQTVATWNNTLLKDSRPGTRVVVGVEDPYEEAPKGIVLQILRGISRETVERYGWVGVHFYTFFSSLLSLLSNHANFLWLLPPLPLLIPLL
ncbi:MAG: hypothetical protein GY847_40510, partial [Proteobacteria bacterium]|nr:hypothetical protein [Pseudomonadota bacterium]